MAQIPDDNNNNSELMKNEQISRSPKITFLQFFFPISLLPIGGLVACFIVSVYYHYEVSLCS